MTSVLHAGRPGFSLTQTCCSFFRRFATTVAHEMEPVAAVMDLVEQVYIFLVSAGRLRVGFERSLLKERRHARAFLSDPFADGWNVVSTAQSLAYTALPRPVGTLAANWSRAFRMRLCACLLVAAKWKKGDSCMGGDTLIRAAACFMPESEQQELLSDRRVHREVLAAVRAAEGDLLRNVFCMSLGEGVVSRAEWEISELLARQFIDPREASVTRNLCVFQLRAVVRHGAALLEQEFLATALIYNALRWMKAAPESVEGGVRWIAAEVSGLIALAESGSLWVGLFADPNGHTGRFLARPAEELSRDA
jgi:hypothetical protein